MRPVITRPRRRRQAGKLCKGLVVESVGKYAGFPGGNRALCICHFMMTFAGMAYVDYA